MDKPIVRIENIDLAYHNPDGETKTLKNISFDIYKGEFISIVGPSGCGKSTLLSILAKLLTPSGGQIYIENEPLNQSQILMGYMLQKDHLFEWRSIWENVILGLEIQNKLTEEKKEHVNNMLIRYGLSDFKDKRPSQLSGGMRQRAALIRTLALEPEILLLDEPFSALDYQTRLHVCDEISTIIKQEGKTAILVTHDISEAVSVSNRVVVLSKRPATVKRIFDIKLENQGASPMKAREDIRFKDYFNFIWKELDFNV